MLIDELKKQSQKTEIDISVLTNIISDLKDKRNTINKDIQSKESILEDINTNLSLNELKKLDVNILKYPFVLKQCVGFLSFGVYPIRNKKRVSFRFDPLKSILWVSVLRNFCLDCL